ncbi:hypothetical protein QUF76_10510 [Desulfobacterales bacterium HSG16]|nr:hypothetical protein [Desulfobacterales bacterium HSG16]
MQAKILQQKIMVQFSRNLKNDSPTGITYGFYKLLTIQTWHHMIKIKKAGVKIKKAGCV